MTQDRDFPQRKKLRLKNFDYSSQNLYFVTVCVKNGKPLLSRIVGDGAHTVPLQSTPDLDGAHTVPLQSTPDLDGAHTVPKKIILKPYGEIAEKHILRIDKVYPNVYVEKYIIMPNHIHMLIFIDRDDSRTMQVSSKEENDNGTMRASSKEENNNGTMRASSPTVNLSTVVRTFKTMVTKEIGISVWQRSFYDEIIKNEMHFQNVWNYIEYNALKEYSK